MSTCGQRSCSGATWEDRSGERWRFYSTVCSKTPALATEMGRALQFAAALSTYSLLVFSFIRFKVVTTHSMRRCEPRQSRNGIGLLTCKPDLPNKNSIRRGARVPFVRWNKRLGFAVMGYAPNRKTTLCCRPGCSTSIGSRIARKSGFGFSLAAPCTDWEQGGNRSPFPFDARVETHVDSFSS